MRPNHSAGVEAEPRSISLMGEAKVSRTSGRRPWLSKYVHQHSKAPQQERLYAKPGEQRGQFRGGSD